MRKISIEAGSGIARFGTWGGYSKSFIAEYQGQKFFLFENQASIQRIDANTSASVFSQIADDLRKQARANVLYKDKETFIESLEISGRKVDIGTVTFY